MLNFLANFKTLFAMGCGLLIEKHSSMLVAYMVSFEEGMHEGMLNYRQIFRERKSLNVIKNHTKVTHFATYIRSIFLYESSGRHPAGRPRRRRKREENIKVFLNIFFFLELMGSY
jgi:hypothetical protein